jgi:hypothetical protein
LGVVIGSQEDRIHSDWIPYQPVQDGKGRKDPSGVKDL